MEEPLQYIIWNDIKITDWIKALGVLLGVPITLISLFKLFRKDSKHDEKITELQSLVTSQNDINTSLKGQLDQLTSQTEILHKRNLFQIDHNIMTEKSLKLDLKKYEDETIVKFDDLSEYVIEILKGLEGPINNQIDGFKNASIELSKKENVGFEIMIDPSLRISNITNIKNQDLFKVFVQENNQEREEKIESFLKLEKAVALIEYVKTELRNDVNMVFSLYQTHESQWGEAASLVQRHIESFTSKNIAGNISPAQDPFVGELNEIFGTWFEPSKKGENGEEGKNVRDMYYMRDNYIEKIRILCNKYTTDPRTDILLPLCTQAEGAFQNVNCLRTKLKGIVDNYNVQLTKSLKNINQSLTTLEIKKDGE